MLSSRMLATHHAQRSLDAGLIPIPRSLPTCPRKPFRINTCKKHRGVGVLLLTTHPMRMRILSESAAADESKDLSSHPVRIAVLGSIARFLRLGWAYGATRDLSSHPMRMRILGITFFFASLFCVAALLSPAFAGANGV